MKRPGKLLLVLIVVVVLAICFGAAYNALALHRLQNAHPVPGAFYTVDGHRMHLYCTGTGSPAVVLEAGLGDDWIYWQKVQPEIAKTTRICSYDRAGLGWSDPQSPRQDAPVISSHLHSLLQAAHEAGPFIFVGASAGGFYVRQYFSKFPADLAGVVLVDSSVPEQLTVFPGRMDTPENRRKRHRDANSQWLREITGYARITGHCNGDVEKGLENYAPLVAAETCRPTFTTAWLPEYDAFWASADEAARAHCCGDVPLFIISQDPDRPKDGWDAQSIAQQPMWSQLQDNLKRLSPHSRRIIAKLSGHHVMIDRPDVVIDGIQHVITDVRRHQPDPQDGTTIRQ